jgi:1-acyl-sn-glycerol-3-phosphate acyltransferase
MPYSLKLFLVVLVTIPSCLLIVASSLFDRKGRLAYGIGRLWAWMILTIGRIRLKVQGLDRLDPGRQYIFVANHQSNLDIPVLAQTLSKFQLRWLAKKELLRVPLFGWALWASRHIIVDRSSRSKAMASLRKAKERIAEGISVVFFPEGTRSPDGQLLPFKRGGFVLALQTQTPIVPITINGSGAVLPKGDWRIRGGEIEVIISDPISLEKHHPGNLRSLLSQVRRTIESHSQKHADFAGNEAISMDDLTAAEGLRRPGYL